MDLQSELLHYQHISEKCVLEVSFARSAPILMLTCVSCGLPKDPLC
jgi:hypothetical protein